MIGTRDDGTLAVLSAPDEAVISEQLLDAQWREQVGMVGLDYDPDTRLLVIHAYDGDYCYDVETSVDFRSRARVMHRIHDAIADPEDDK